MQPRELKVGEIVQIDPQHDDGRREPWFGGCLMVVTDPKPWGAQGYVQSAGVAGQQYYGCTWEHMEPTGGMARWVAGTAEDSATLKISADGSIFNAAGELVRGASIQRIAFDARRILRTAELSIEVTHVWYNRALPRIVEAVLNGGDAAPLPPGFTWHTLRSGQRAVFPPGDTRDPRNEQHGRNAGTAK